MRRLSSKDRAVLFTTPEAILTASMIARAMETVFPETIAMITPRDIAVLFELPDMTATTSDRASTMVSVKAKFATFPVGGV